MQVVCMNASSTTFPRYVDIKVFLSGVFPSFETSTIVNSGDLRGRGGMAHALGAAATNTVKSGKNTARRPAKTAKGEIGGLGVEIRAVDRMFLTTACPPAISSKILWLPSWPWAQPCRWWS